jgi:hypothetical protein
MQFYTRSDSRVIKFIHKKQYMPLDLMSVHKVVKTCENISFDPIAVALEDSVPFAKVFWKITQKTLKSSVKLPWPMIVSLPHFKGAKCLQI